MGEPHRTKPSVRIALLIVGWFGFVSALVGAIGLTAFGGMGIPLEWLVGTPFDDYTIPGIILGVVVGGSQVLALLATHGGYSIARGLHATAGLVMLIWVFVEVALILVWSPLHGLYFTAGVLQIVLAVLALGAWPRPLLRREAGEG